MAADWIKDPTEWTSDDWVVLIIVSFGGGTLLLGAGPRIVPWLQRHQVLLAPGDGLLTIPGLGALDLPRILILAAALVLLTLFAVAVRMKGRPAGQDTTRATSPGQ